MSALEQESSEALLEILQYEFEEGRVHNTSKGEEYIFDCPFCGGDSRGPCFHFNVSKGVGHCWRASCGWEGGYKDFLNQLFNWDEFEISDKLKLRADTDSTLMLRKLFRSDKEEISLMSKHQEHTFLKGSVQITKENLHLYPDVENFLLRRRYVPEEFANSHDLYWPPQYGPYKGRVVFLIRTKANYTYLAYAMSSDEKIKTINAPDSNMLEFLYNYNRALDADTVFVTEGIFDCARVMTFQSGFSDVKIAAVSLLGTRIGEGESQTRACLLRELKAREIVICLDSDAKESAWKIYHYLKTMIPNKILSVMDLSFGLPKFRDMDPDDTVVEHFRRAYDARYIRQTTDTLLQAFGRSISDW